jgi:hypothetical protein
MGWLHSSGGRGGSLLCKWLSSVSIRLGKDATVPSRGIYQRCCFGRVFRMPGSCKRLVITCVIIPGATTV